MPVAGLALLEPAQDVGGILRHGNEPGEPPPSAAAHIAFEPPRNFGEGPCHSLCSDPYSLEPPQCAGPDLEAATDRWRERRSYG